MRENLCLIMAGPMVDIRVLIKFPRNKTLTIHKLQTCQWTCLVQVGIVFSINSWTYDIIHMTLFCIWSLWQQDESRPICWYHCNQHLVKTHPCAGSGLMLWCSYKKDRCARVRIMQPFVRKYYCEWRLLRSEESHIDCKLLNLFIQLW